MGTPTPTNWSTYIDPALQQASSTPRSTATTPAATPVPAPATPAGSTSTAIQPTPVRATPAPITAYSPYTVAYTPQQYQQFQAYQAHYANIAAATRQSLAQTPITQIPSASTPAAPAATATVEESTRALTATPPQPVASTSRVKLDRTTNGPLNPDFDVNNIRPRVKAIAEHHKLSGEIPTEVLTYVAAAVRARLEQLVKEMAVAAGHRTDTQFDRPAGTYEGGGGPMWSLVIRSDVSKLSNLLERLEREEELKIRRERKERADMTAAHTAALAAQAGGMGGMDLDDDEGGRKKKKKDGPGVTARNMSEDVRKKMSNAVATQAAGLGGKYSWMNATNAAAAAAKPLKTSTPAVSTPASSSSGGGWARAYMPKKTAETPPPAPVPEAEDTRVAITLPDAQFVVDKDRTCGKR